MRLLDMKFKHNGTEYKIINKEKSGSKVYYTIKDITQNKSTVLISYRGLKSFISRNNITLYK